MAKIARKPKRHIHWDYIGKYSSNHVASRANLCSEILALDHEAIHFQSSSSSIYTLHASGGTVILTRTHPLNPATEITICTPVLATPSATSPLLATIFPSLAELMALDTASNIALTHRLSRLDSMDLQTEALRRAHESESASLLWDSDSAAYYLAHPSLSTATSTSHATLPIRITPGDSITLLSTTQEPILSLSLLTHAMTIHVPAIAAISPSLYTLDTLISTILTLLLHLHRKTALLVPQSVPLPHFDPPPMSRPITRPVRAKTRSSSRHFVPKPESSKLTRWLSIRSTQNPARSTTPNSFVPPRSPAFSTYSSPYLGSTVDPKDLEAGIASPIPSMSMPIPALPAEGVAPELRKETTGVDLSRFQGYDLSDPELGGGTKAVLRVIYWAFSVLVWLLGVGVGVLAAGVVALGGCVGGKKGSKEGRLG